MDGWPPGALCYPFAAQGAGARRARVPFTMYAVIRIGGKQYRVEQGQTLLVDRQPYGAGESFSPEVLMTAGDDVRTDRGALAGAVSVQVVEHLRGPKIKVFRYTPKKGSSKRRGHRSELSRIRVEQVGAEKAAKKTKST